MAAKVKDVMIDRDKIVAMCLRISSDKAIAKYLGCTEDQVAVVRASLPVRREYDHDRKADAVATPDGSSLSAELGSRNLLVRQLQTGMHWLKRDQFYATVKMLQQKGALR